MNSLYNELKIEIFKCTKSPISLLLANHDWYALSKDPHVRAEWLIYKYGKAHALFHAVRLTGTFITLDVTQSLLARNAIVSRYFIQRLYMQIEASIYSDGMSKIENAISSPWASKLPLPVLFYLINEASKILKDDNLVIDEVDMRLFCSLFVGTSQSISRNIEEIKNLILNKKFIPFPPRSRNDATIGCEKYPSRDGYENRIHINIIAKAILNYPELVNMWKTIGYQEICSDFNDMVIQEGLLRLFPPTPPLDWTHPNVDAVVSFLKQFIDIGFQLHEDVAIKSLNLFENKSTSEIILNGFKVINPKITITNNIS